MPGHHQGPWSRQPGSPYVSPALTPYVHWVTRRSAVTGIGPERTSATGSWLARVIPGPSPAWPSVPGNHCSGRRRWLPEQATGLTSAHRLRSPRAGVCEWSSVVTLRAGVWGPEGTPGWAEAGGWCGRSAHPGLMAWATPETGPETGPCRTEGQPGHSPSSRRHLCSCHSRPGSQWDHAWGRRSKRHPPAVRSGGRPDSRVAGSLRRGGPSGWLPSGPARPPVPRSSWLVCPPGNVTWASEPRRWGQTLALPLSGWQG